MSNLPNSPIQNPNAGKNQTPSYNAENVGCGELGMPHGGDINESEVEMDYNDLDTSWTSTSTGSSSLVQMVEGDLDGGGCPDWVIVLHDHGPSPVSSPPPEMEYDPPMLNAYLYGRGPWDGTLAGNFNSHPDISQIVSFLLMLPDFYTIRN